MNAVNYESQNATELGLNPFGSHDSGGSPMVQRGLADPYDPRAKGLDGDLLDAMVKGRWQEGYAVGVGDGRRAAEARYEAIFNEGFAAGRSMGATEEGARTRRELIPVLQSVAEVLAKTRMALEEVDFDSDTEVRDRLDVSVRELVEVLERWVGASAFTANVGEAVDGQSVPKEDEA